MRTTSEAESIAAVTRRLTEDKDQRLNSLSAVCLIHLRLLVAGFSDRDTIKHLLECEAVLLQRIAEDMQRYSLKHFPT